MSWRNFSCVTFIVKNSSFNFCGHQSTATRDDCMGHIFNITLQISGSLLFLFRCCLFNVSGKTTLRMRPYKVVLTGHKGVYSSGKKTTFGRTRNRVLPSTPLVLYTMRHALHENWLWKCRHFPDVGGAADSLQGLNSLLAIHKN